MQNIIIFLLGSLLLLGCSRDAQKEPAESAQLTVPTNSTALIQRTYKINLETFIPNLKQLLPPEAGESNQELMVRFLKENDIEFKKPAAVFLSETKSMLLVKATEADLDKVTTLVEKIVNK